MESVMTRPSVFPKDCVLCGVVCIAAVAVLPAIAVAAFMLRTFLIAGVVIALLALCAMCAFNGRFRKWLVEETAEEIEHRGLRLGQDAYMSPQHSWALLYSSVIVGVDDMLQAALGPVDGLELPEPGTHVKRGDPLFVLRHGERRIEVAAPVSGIVLATNEAVRANPELINEKPFHEGWVVRLQSEDLATERKSLLHGKEARTWFRREVDGLYEQIEPDDQTPETLPTGRIHERLDEPAWRNLSRRIGAHHAATG